VPRTRHTFNTAQTRPFANRHHFVHLDAAENHLTCCGQGCVSDTGRNRYPPIPPTLFCIQLESLREGGPGITPPLYTSTGKVRENDGQTGIPRLDRAVSAPPPLPPQASSFWWEWGSDCSKSRQNNEKWVAVPRTTLLRADTTLHPAPCSHYNRLTCILFAVRKASDIITVLAQEGGGRVPKFEGLVAWDPAGLGAEEPSTACLCEISRAFRCRNQYRRSNRSRRIRVLLAASGASWPRNSNASARGPRCN